MDTLLFDKCELAFLWLTCSIFIFTTIIKEICKSNMNRRDPKKHDYGDITFISINQNGQLLLSQPTLLLSRV